MVRPPSEVKIETLICTPFCIHAGLWFCRTPGAKQFDPNDYA